MNNKSNYLAEVTDSFVHSFTARCWAWDQAPTFGGLVCVSQNDSIVFGLVYRLHTGTDDPAREVYAYQKTLEELHVQQPQLFEFLKTDVSALILGYQQHGTIRYECAQTPLMIHSFVRHATAQEYAQVLQSPDYLHSLFGQALQVGNIDELLIALLRHAKNHGVLEQQAVIDCLELFDVLIDNDYRRLKVLIERIEVHVL